MAKLSGFLFKQPVWLLKPISCQSIIRDVGMTWAGLTALALYLHTALLLLLQRPLDPVHSDISGTRGFLNCTLPSRCPDGTLLCIPLLSCLWLSPQCHRVLRYVLPLSLISPLLTTVQGAMECEVRVEWRSNLTELSSYDPLTFPSRLVVHINAPGWDRELEAPV